MTSSLLAGTRRGLAVVGVVAALGAATAAAEQPVPTPIGRGAAYHPAARGPLAPSRFRCLRTTVRRGFRVHLELFANRRVVIVPAGIGVAGVRRLRFGRIVAARCHAPLWTLDPSGVVWVARRGLRLADLFTVWRQPLGPRRLLSFRARRNARLLAFRSGRRLRLPAASVELRDRDQLVLELNGYVRPHRSYLFPREHR
jgi:hypothetical protein